MRAFPFLVALSLLSAAPAAAQDVVAGAALYLRHCAGCHGVAGAGDGPVAPGLNPQPTDLTRLAATNGGVFPAGRVVRRIDGGDPLVAHGSPMPVWRDFFSGPAAMTPGNAGAGVATVQPVADLVAFLLSLQDG